MCAGLAEYLGIDANLLRIAAVILAFSGPGIPAYLVAWVLLPDSDPSPGQAHLRHGVGSAEVGAQVIGIAVLAGAATLVWGRWEWPGSGLLLPAGLVAVGVWLLVRDRSDEPPPGSGAPHRGTADRAGTPPGATARWDASPGAGDVGPAGSGSGGDPAAPPDLSDLSGAGAPVGTAGPPAGPTPATGAAGAGSTSGSAAGSHWSAEWSWASPEPTAHWQDPHRTSSWASGWDDRTAVAPEPAGHPRSTVVVPVTLGVLLVWFGLATLLGFSLQVALTAGLAVLGVGLVVGSIAGRVRLLIVPAVLLLLALAGTTSLGVPLRGGVGERVWAPQGLEELRGEYRLLAGSATLDLREVELAGTGRVVEIDASVALGELIVRVPAGVHLDVRAEAAMGQVRLDDQAVDGLGVDERHVTRDLDPDDGAFVLQLAVGAGEVLVEQDAPATSDDPPEAATTTTTAEVPG